MTYKRYMIFCSDEYDNPSPFDCVDFHTDDKSKAISYAQSDDSYEVRIFDRVKGVKVIYES